MDFYFLTYCVPFEMVIEQRSCDKNDRADAAVTPATEGGEGMGVRATEKGLGIKQHMAEASCSKAAKREVLLPLPS